MGRSHIQQSLFRRLQTSLRDWVIFSPAQPALKRRPRIKPSLRDEEMHSFVRKDVGKDKEMHSLVRKDMGNDKDAILSHAFSSFLGVITRHEGYSEIYPQSHTNRH